MINVSWKEINFLCDNLCQQIRKSGIKYEFIYAIPKGGLVPGVILSHSLGIRMKFDTYNPSNFKYLVVDEINDTGKTLFPFSRDENADIAVLMTRHSSEVKSDYSGMTINHNHFMVFPWEKINVI